MTIFDQEIEILGSHNKRLWSFMSLIFSTFYFAPHWANSDLNSLQNVFFSIAIYLVFVVCYCVTILRPIYQGKWFLLAFIVLSITGAWHNPGATILLGYAAFVIGYYGSSKSSVFMLLTMLLSLTCVVSIGLPIAEFTLIPAFASSAGLYVFGLLERRSTIQAQQQQLSEKAIEKLSATAERERIGRDLHDSVGHALSAIALKAELAEKRLAKQQIKDVKQDLNELSEMARCLLGDVRRAVSGMQKRGLVAELHKLQALLESKGLQVMLSLQATTNEIAELSDAQESELIMIAKELATNIIKHSNATSVDIGLTAQERKVCLSITDNGSLKTLSEGNGLTGMRKRLVTMQGELVFTISGGLCAFASVPVGNRSTS